MFQEVVEHFGGRIQRIEAQWFNQPGLDQNYIEYYAAIDSGFTRSQAAWSTFTGQQAHRFGFTSIESIEEGPDEVIVTFAK